MLRKIKKLSAFNYQLSVIKDLFSCLLSALLLILPFNNGKLWILAWFGFVPLFFTLNNKSLRQAVFLFFITGVFFWSGVIYWLVHVTLAGAIILILYLSLYFAVFGLVIRPFTRCSKPYVLLLIPSTWVLLEYLRAYLLTGFPWALLGYSQYLNLTVIQVSDITGAYGVSFLVMMVNAAIVEIIFSARTRDQTRVKLISALLLLFLLPVLGYGYFSLSKNTDRSAGQLMRIAVVQGNIPQELKWVNIAQGAIINKYLYLTRGAVKNTPDLIIWPEAAVPYVLENTSSVFALFEKIPAVLLFGAVTKKNNLYYNSALLYDKNSLLLGQYNKLHLVPYGEFIPFRGIFPFLEYIAPIGDIEKGKDLELFTLYSTYSLLSAKFSVLICFEDLF
ncbi:MAG: apolipoprotein N-acyltransferase, partial [Candidatus Omnitrophica bacterium]|nr:apolipoprotein N-acyltransferase [Candidatus Omnitrophota bacterium]